MPVASACVATDKFRRLSAGFRYALAALHRRPRIDHRVVALAHLYFHALAAAGDAQLMPFVVPVFGSGIVEQRVAAAGVLGHLGGILSAPRRAVMSALQMPDTGSELLHKTFGMDPESPLTQALGFGAETLLDPLTYLMMPGGALAGKLGKPALAHG